MKETYVVRAVLHCCKGYEFSTFEEALKKAEQLNKRNKYRAHILTCVQADGMRMEREIDY